MGITKKGEPGNVHDGLLYERDAHVWFPHVHGFPCLPFRKVLLPRAAVTGKGLGLCGVSPEDLIGVLRLFYFKAGKKYEK